MSDFPDDENGDVLREMLADGDDLGLPRDIDFAVVFDREQDAAAFHKALNGSECHLEMGPYDDDDGMVKWDVTVTYFMLPDHGEISGIEQALGGLAEPMGGRNDGWGCFPQP